MHGESHAQVTPRLTTAHLETRQRSLSLAPCCRVSGISRRPAAHRDFRHLAWGEHYVVEDLWKRKSLGSCCASKEIPQESEPVVCLYFKEVWSLAASSAPKAILQIPKTPHTTTSPLKITSLERLAMHDYDPPSRWSCCQCSYFPNCDTHHCANCSHEFCRTCAGSQDEVDDSIPISPRHVNLMPSWYTTGNTGAALLLAEAAENQSHTLLPIEDDIARKVGDGELDRVRSFDVGEDAALQIHAIAPPSPRRRGNGSVTSHLTTTGGVGIVELNSLVNI